MALVEESRALGLREDEVREETEAEVGVEGKPSDDEVGPVFDKDEDGVNHPVHEPWCQESRIRGAKGFVGGEDWEEDCQDGAIIR